MTVVTIIACIVIMVVLIWFVNNTPAGKAMLAVSEDTRRRPADGRQRQRDDLR